MCNGKVNKKNNKTSFRVCVLLVLLLFCVREGETKIRIDPTLFPASQTSRVKIVNLNLRDYKEQVKVAIPSDEKHGEEALKMLDQFNDFGLEKKKADLLKMKEKLDKALTDVESGLKKKDRFLTLIAKTFKPDFKDTRKAPQNKERFLMSQAQVIVTDFIGYLHNISNEIVKRGLIPPLDENAIKYLYGERKDFHKYLLGLSRNNSDERYENLYFEKGLKEDEMDLLGMIRYSYKFDVYDANEQKLDQSQVDLIGNVEHEPGIFEEVEVFDTGRQQKVKYDMTLLNDVEIADFNKVNVETPDRNAYQTVSYTQQQSVNPVHNFKQKIAAVVENSPTEDKATSEKDPEGCHCTNYLENLLEDKENNYIEVLIANAKQSHKKWLIELKKAIPDMLESEANAFRPIPEDWETILNKFIGRKLIDEPIKERKLNIAPTTDSFIRFISINDPNLNSLLNADVWTSGDPLTYVFNDDANGVKVFNVGAGNGIVAKTILQNDFRISPVHGLHSPIFIDRFDLLFNTVDMHFTTGTLINWLIDAGSNALPMGLDPGNNVVRGLRQNHETAEDMADHFCPAGFNFLLGVIVITHTDGDHYNLIYSILARCSFRYFSYMIATNIALFRRILVEAMKFTINCFTLVCDGNLTMAIANITAVGARTDRWSAGQLTFWGYMNDLTHVNGTMIAGAPDGYIALQKTFMWQKLNAYFSDNALLWIMPPNYDSTHLTTVYGFNNDLKDVFGARHGALGVDGYEGALCTSLLFTAFGDTAIFPRNRIVIDAFPLQDKNIQILNNPRIVNAAGTVAGVNPNRNSLMIRLRHTQWAPPVLILGDAWMDTYVHYLIDKGNNWPFIDGTIVASHHGAETEGSHGITAMLSAERVIFSSGSINEHPKISAVRSSVITVSGAANVPNHYIVVEGGLRANTDRPIYHTAGTRRIGPFHHYYSV